MATPAQRTNTWTLDEWYGQAVAGTQGTYVGDKQLWVWGNRVEGQLGLGDQVFRSSPMQLPAGSGSWAALANYSTGHANNVNTVQGYLTMFATKSDASLWGWGQNEAGEIPVNTSDSYSSPKQIPGSYTLSSRGYYGGGAIKTDGTLWTWGQNTDGRLGVNNKTNYSSPMQVGTGTDWKDIRHGSGTAFALKTDGTLWTWGNNAGGSLGHNNRTQYSSPKQVPGTDWNNFTPTGSGGNFALVYKTDETLWGWGDNGYGQQMMNTGPNGGAERTSSPAQIAGGAWSATAGSSNFLGVKSDGTLWSAGYNKYGTLGLNSNIQYSSPMQVGTDTNWTTALFNDDRMAGGVKTDGTLWMWGADKNGSLGLNTSTDTDLSSPTQVGTDTNWGDPASMAAQSQAMYFMKNL